MDKTRGMTCRIMNDVTGMECRANGRWGWRLIIAGNNQESCSGYNPESIDEVSDIKCRGNGRKGRSRRGGG